ncbi:DUF1016 N-terminal domain-containing protein [Dysosmobacter sp.]|uniref:DUF1016 N-terminal domain-containing protein n=1 Tax=Dysosmobacter sp. TaxID=2591382 RepID=UPI003FA4B1CB
MNENEISRHFEVSAVVQEIKAVLSTARNNVAQQVNNELLNTYWNIGRIICEYEQSEPGRADYGKQTLKELSKVLTQEFGKGFSRSNRDRRKFCVIDVPRQYENLRLSQE